MKKLSKSDFQLASTCAKKLVYKKKGYPSTNDTNEYMQMLAKGGYVVGLMASLLYPDGIEIAGNTDEAIVETKKLILNNDTITLFESAFEFDQRIARVDIFVKNGLKIDLIEVKSASFNSEESNKKQYKDLKKYIDDVTYQYTIIKDNFPNYEINCYLLMPDKAKRTEIDGLAGWFKIIDSAPSKEAKYEAPEEVIATKYTTFKKPEVIFNYDNDVNRLKYIDQINNLGILERLDITDYVKNLEGDIRKSAAKFIAILNNDLQTSNDDYSISKVCKTSEYYVSENPNCGFFECWPSIKTLPSIFDLYFGGALGNNQYLNEIIKEGKYDFEDINSEIFNKANGELGARGERQMIQYNNTINHKEHHPKELNDLLNTLQYPLHFIDFETYTGAIPFYKGMRPYELIAFQWSCHTIKQPGSAPIHQEWLHTECEFPNFQFAESLMKLIGNSGTPLMWATHENTTLRTIYYQMEDYGYKNDELKNWLEEIIKDKNLGTEGRLIDMNSLTSQYYFHPEMKGKTSIKKVLPAIWNNNLEMHKIPYFKEFSAIDIENKVIDPYDTLFNLVQVEVDDDEVSEELKVGTAAMRAYYRILFDDNIAKSKKEELKLRLKKYCELDTLSMVIIWKYWKGKIHNS